MDRKYHKFIESIYGNMLCSYNVDEEHQVVDDVWFTRGTVDITQAIHALCENEYLKSKLYHDLEANAAECDKKAEKSLFEQSSALAEDHYNLNK